MLVKVQRYGTTDEGEDDSFAVVQHIFVNPQYVAAVFASTEQRSDASPATIVKMPDGRGFKVAGLSRPGHGRPL